MKPPDSPAATRSKRMAWGQVFRGFGSEWEQKPTECAYGYEIDVPDVAASASGPLASAAPAP